MKVAPVGLHTQVEQREVTLSGSDCGIFSLGAESEEEPRVGLDIRPYSVAADSLLVRIR
jgi:hypothetical protein